MKKSTIYEIAIKLGGLHLFFLAITAFKDVLVYAISYYEMKSGGFDDFEGNNIFIVLSSISSFSLILAFAFLLTFHTDKIVRKICKASEYEEEVNITTNKKVLYEMGLVLSAFILIIDTLPQFLVKFRAYLYLSEKDYLIGNNNKGFLLIAVSKIVLGVLIIAGAEMISSFVVKEKPVE